MDLLSLGLFKLIYGKLYRTVEPICPDDLIYM